MDRQCASTWKASRRAGANESLGSAPSELVAPSPLPFEALGAGSIKERLMNSIEGINAGRAIECWAGVFCHLYFVLIKGEKFDISCGKKMKICMRAPVFLCPLL